MQNTSKHKHLLIDHDLLHPTWNESQDTSWQNLREAFMFHFGWVQPGRSPSTASPQRKKHTELTCPRPGLHLSLTPSLIPSCDLSRSLDSWPLFSTELLLSALVSPDLSYHIQLHLLIILFPPGSRNSLVMDESGIKD